MKYNETHFASLVACQKRYPEIYGQVEATLKSKAGSIRVDILTDKYAYECKFGVTSWKTAIGQALTYAQLSKRKPGIIVFVRTDPKFHEKDQRGFELLQDTIQHYKLKIDLKRFFVNRSEGTISKYNNLDWDVPTTVSSKDVVEEVYPTSILNRLLRRK